MAVEPIEKLIKSFSMLPGIGQKTAQRLSYYILSMPQEKARLLATSIWDAKKSVKECSVCASFTTEKVCEVCADERRDHSVICVVSDQRDVFAIERMREFKGVYHVLGGAISPLDGVGPDSLRVGELMARLEGTSEVIIATNIDVEGEATAAYLKRQIAPRGIKVTRIAHGLPVGGDLEYADEVTLKRAIDGRREMD